MLYRENETKLALARERFREKWTENDCFLRRHAAATAMPSALEEEEEEEEEEGPHAHITLPTVAVAWRCAAEIKNWDS